MHVKKENQTDIEAIRLSQPQGGEKEAFTHPVAKKNVPICIYAAYRLTKIGAGPFSLIPIRGDLDPATGKPLKRPEKGYANVLFLGSTHREPLAEVVAAAKGVEQDAVKSGMDRKETLKTVRAAIRAEAARYRPKAA